MSNGAININNLTTTNLSLDVQFGDKRNLRQKLNPVGQVGASVDVGDLTSLSELNANAQIQALLSSTPAKISITGSRGTTDIPGSDLSTLVDTSGMTGANPRLRITWAAGSAGARDIAAYVANFPFAARCIDSQVMVSTAVAGTAQLRLGAGGTGNILSAANSTTAAGRVRDPGTGQTGGSGVFPTIARGDSLYVRLTAGDSAGSYIVDFERIS